MPDWKDRSNPSSAGGALSPGGRARSGSGREVRGSGPSRSRASVSRGTLPSGKHRMQCATAAEPSTSARSRGRAIRFGAAACRRSGLAEAAPDRERPGAARGADGAGWSDRAHRRLLRLERPRRAAGRRRAGGVTVEIADLRERPIDIARERIAALPRPCGLAARPASVPRETHTGPFDIGVALRPRRGDGRGLEAACAAARLRARPVLRRPARAAGEQRAERPGEPPKTEPRRLFRFTQVGGLRGAPSSDEAALARAGDCAARDR